MAQPLDTEFTATLQKSPSRGGWTYVSFYMVGSGVASISVRV